MHGDTRREPVSDGTIVRNTWHQWIDREPGSPLAADARIKELEHDQ